MSYPYVDSREGTFNTILSVLSQPYAAYKWTTILRLCRVLGDEIILEGLTDHLKPLQKEISMTIYEWESLTIHSDSLDNFIKVKGKKITELEVNHYLQEVDEWLTTEFQTFCIFPLEIL